MGSIISGIIGGIVGWFATDFVARPIRQFFQLRGEICATMVTFDNVRAPVNDRGEATEGFDDDDMVRLKEAQVAFRELGARMLAFAHTELLATWLVEGLQHDTIKAGQSLIGLSNRIGIYGNERHLHRQNVLAALRIKGL